MAKHTTTTPEALADVVKAARAAHGHSQSKAAAAIGVSVDTVRDWEQGRRTTPHPLCRKAAARYIRAAGLTPPWAPR